MEEIGDMIFGVIEWINKETDMVMSITAWQTALLMNSTGNYKSPVKPEKLYKPITKPQAKKSKKTVDIKEKQKELKEIFGI